MKADEVVHFLTRSPRVEINQTGLLHPWGLKAQILDMSLSGAFLLCKDFPEDLYTTPKGEIEINSLKLPGQVVRIDHEKIAIQFEVLSESTKQELSLFLDKKQTP